MTTADGMLDMEAPFDLNVYEAEIIEWIQYHFDPARVFKKDALELWAEENGYVKEAGA